MIVSMAIDESLDGQDGTKKKKAKTEAGIWEFDLNVPGVVEPEIEAHP